MSCLLVIFCAPVLSQVPEKITWQGYLTDGSGPLDGPVHLVISLYPSKATSSHFYRLDTTGVVADNGVVNVPLGPFDGVSLDVPAFVGVAVDGGGELLPRSPLYSVPYALSVFGMRAERASDASYHGVNVLAGAANNTIAAGVVGGTISGGGGLVGTTPSPNSVEADFGTVAGGRGNTATVSGAVYGGATVGGGEGNTASGGNATVAGGYNNTAGGLRATVAGGVSNEASGNFATVAGGGSNKASGVYSAVAGGRLNTAGGDYSFAGGNKAHVRGVASGAGPSGDYGTFVWSDFSSTFDEFVSTGPNQFLIRAVGGVGIGTNAPGTPFALNAGKGGNDVGLTQGEVGGAHTFEFTTSDADGDQATRLLLRGDNDDADVEFYTGAKGSERRTMILKGDTGNLGIANPSPGWPIEVGTSSADGNNAHLTHGGTWTSTSSRAVKEGFEAIDKKEILDKVAYLPVLKWRYTGTDEGDHIGPMAEDFRQIFGLGHSDQAITMVDADGVALAAIQGLYQMVQELRTENQELRALIEAMDR